MLFIVATNIVVSQPPECRPTGMPTARANLITVQSQPELSLAQLSPNLFCNFNVACISSQLPKQKEGMFYIYDKF